MVTSSPLSAPLESRARSLARGAALFIGLFSALNLVARFRGPRFDANLWWIDFRALPDWIGVALLGVFSGLLIAWSVRPRARRGRLLATIVTLAVVTLFALVNSIGFFRLRSAGVISTPVPIPFSALVVVVLIFIGVSLARPRVSTPRLRRSWIAVGFAALAAGFPLAQIVCFGLTDYRRPAHAIVVFGARAYADGQPSDALADRTLTAIDLYRRGLAPRLIFSGGPGDGPLSEAQVMRRIALARGVPDSAITLDDAGLNTDATVRNTAATLSPGQTVLAVTHVWHLPRAKLRFDRAGLTAYTVPADERGQPLRNTPYLIARESSALWVYYLRALVG